MNARQEALKGYLKTIAFVPAVGAALLQVGRTGASVTSLSNLSTAVWQCVWQDMRVVGAELAKNGAMLGAMAISPTLDAIVPPAARPEVDDLLSRGMSWLGEAISGGRRK